MVSLRKERSDGKLAKTKHYATGKIRKLIPAEVGETKFLGDRTSVWKETACTSIQTRRHEPTANKRNTTLEIHVTQQLGNKLLPEGLFLPIKHDKRGRENAKAIYGLRQVKSIVAVSMNKFDRMVKDVIEERFVIFHQERLPVCAQGV